MSAELVIDQGQPFGAGRVERMVGDAAFATVAEAARILRLSKSAVYNLLDKGELAYCRFGKSRRIPTQALIDYVQRCAVEVA